jgi:Carboxypeptidase regulatory-like domain/WD40-like Beta Propeller Repeat/Tetratricopeptide repeat
MKFIAKVLSTVALATASFALHAQTPVEKADKQYEMHAYRLAAKSYEIILARDPDDMSVTSRLADAYFHLNDLDNAARLYSKAVKNSNLQPSAFLNYGKTLMMLGLYSDAETQFINYKKYDAAIATNFIKSSRFARENESLDNDMTIYPLSKNNTATSEFGVTVFNNQIVWSSNRTDMKRERDGGINNDWTGSSKNQLFVSPLINNPNNKISFYKSDLKNIYNESHPSFSADGKMVVFMRNNFDDGERISSNGGMEFSTFTASVNEQGVWTDIRAFEHNGTGYSTGFPSLSPDGKSLYFVSNRPGGQGGFDIYVCSKRGNIWGEPRNLGASINTPGDEITPTTDGKTVYFASDYLTGYGGFDIFKTEGIGSESVNLGTGVNSSGDDFGFVMDAPSKMGFFISNRKGGKGKEDIYQVQKLMESVNLIVLDNGKPLKDVKLTVTQGNEKNITALKSGNWIIDLNDGKTYVLQLKKEGFKAKTVKIEPQFVKVARTEEISLEREVPTEMSVATPQYKGSVLDASSDDGLEGVLVKVTNQATNAQLETVTDARGRYNFNLPPNNTYLITYSKEGFVIGKKSVKPTELTNKNLGDIVLKPSAVSDKSELIASTETGLSADKGSVKRTTIPPAPVPPAYDSRPTKVTEKSPNVPQYSVQLLVSSNEDVMNVSKFDNFKSVGNVYVVPEGGKQKVRIGVFNSKETANSVLEKVKAEGNNSAYIVEEKNEKAVASNKFMPAPKPKVEQPKAEQPKAENVTNKSVPKSYVSTVKPPVPTLEKKVENVKKTEVVKKPEPIKKAEVVKKAETGKTVVPVVVDKTFKVKLATMKKPELFDDTKVSAYWKIEQVKQGDFTVFIMDGIKTLQQAKELKAKVKAAGYKDAKVVIKENDTFKVVD